VKFVYGMRTKRMMTNVIPIDVATGTRPFFTPGFQNMLARSGTTMSPIE
jgi:ribosomal protein L31